MPVDDHGSGAADDQRPDAEDMRPDNGSLAAGPTPAARGRGRPAGMVSAARRTRIERSARAVFRRRGYSSTTLQEVADRAGVTRPLVQYYFGDKGGLYREAIEAAFLDVLVPAVQRAVQENTLRRQLSVFLDLAGSAGGADPSVAVLLFTSVVECRSHRELRDSDHDPLSTIRRFLTEAVRGAVERGELRPDTEVGPVVELLLATLCGVGFYAGFIGTPQQVEAVTSAISQLWTGHLWTPTEPT